jgi:hypothetical protein
MYGASTERTGQRDGCLVLRLQSQRLATEPIHPNPRPCEHQQTPQYPGSTAAHPGNRTPVAIERHLAEKTPGVLSDGSPEPPSAGNGRAGRGPGRRGRAHRRHGGVSAGSPSYGCGKQISTARTRLTDGDGSRGHSVVTVDGDRDRWMCDRQELVEDVGNGREQRTTRCLPTERACRQCHTLNLTVWTSGSM